MRRTEKHEPERATPDNKSIEETCTNFVFAVIEKDRKKRGVPLNGDYSALEVANASATLAALLVDLAPFGARWELINAMAKIVRKELRCKRR
jgi:hypothetical protein